MMRWMLRSLAVALLVVGGICQAQQAPIDCATGTGICVRFPTHATQIYRKFTLLRELSVDFYSAVPVYIETTGHIEFVTRYASTMGVAARVALRCVPAGQSLPLFTLTRAPGAAYPEPTLGQWIPGGKSGQNIMSMEDHYGRALLSTPQTLIDPGLCRVEVWATAHTSAAGFSQIDGLAEVNTPTDPSWGPYGFLQVRLTPVTGL